MQIFSVQYTEKIAPTIKFAGINKPLFIMMKKIIIACSFLISMMLFSGCHNSSKPQIFFFNYRYIGIREGRTVKFYVTQDQATWSYSPGKDFVSPESTDEVFHFIGPYIGARKGRIIKFYKTNEKGTWDYGSGKDFTSPGDIDEAFPFSEGAIGVRKGKIIKFYETHKDGSWTPGIFNDFTCPTDVDGAFSPMSSYIALRKGRKIKFYSINSQGTWIYIAARNFISPDDIVWSISTRNDTVGLLFIRIQQFASSVLEAKDIEYEVNIPEKLKGMKLDMQRRQHIYLILKEAINNLIKYSECTTVSINAGYAGGKLKIEVTDDGKGFDPEKIQPGQFL